MRLSLFLVSRDRRRCARRLGGVPAASTWAAEKTCQFRSSIIAGRSGAHRKIGDFHDRAAFHRQRPFAARRIFLIVRNEAAGILAAARERLDRPARAVDAQQIGVGERLGRARVGEPEPGLARRGFLLERRRIDGDRLPGRRRAEIDQASARGTGAGRGWAVTTGCASYAAGAVAWQLETDLGIGNRPRLCMRSGGKARRANSPRPSPQAMERRSCNGVSLLRGARRRIARPADRGRSGSAAGR